MNKNHPTGVSERALAFLGIVGVSSSCEHGECSEYFNGCRECRSIRVYSQIHVIGRNVHEIKITLNYQTPEKHTKCSQLHRPGMLTKVAS